MCTLLKWLRGDAATLLLAATLLGGGAAFWAQPATAAVVENAASVFLDAKEIGVLDLSKPSGNTCM